MLLTPCCSPSTTEYNAVAIPWRQQNCSWLWTRVKDHGSVGVGLSEENNWIDNGKSALLLWSANTRSLRCQSLWPSMCTEQTDFCAHISRPSESSACGYVQALSWPLMGTYGWMMEGPWVASANTTGKKANEMEKPNALGKRNMTAGSEDIKILNPKPKGLYCQSWPTPQQVLQYKGSLSPSRACSKSFSLQLLASLCKQGAPQCFYRMPEMRVASWICISLPNS